MKKILLATILAAAWAWNSSAAVASYDFTGINQTIPDANPSGYANNQTLSGISDSTISSLTVRLDVSGGWNGDLYVYLRHETTGGTGFSVLLNRVGTQSGNPVGYTDTGLNVTLTGSAANNDVHFYQNFSPSYSGSGQLTGTWRIDQGATMSFASFVGLDPNGTWSLYLADMSGGNVSTLNSWGLDLDLAPVPEPVNVALAIFGAGAAAFALRRRLRRK